MSYVLFPLLLGENMVSEPTDEIQALPEGEPVGGKRGVSTTGETIPPSPVTTSLGRSVSCPICQPEQGIAKPAVFLVTGLTVASILSLPRQLKELCFQSTYLLKMLISRKQNS